MSSNTLICATSQKPSYTPSYSFYAERHNGTFIPEESTPNSPRFVCQRLHIFELAQADLANNRWCGACNQIPKRRRRSSFYVNYNDSVEAVDVNCESGHAYQLQLCQLQDFRACPRCPSVKKDQTPLDSKSKTSSEEELESQIKEQEAAFLDTYRRLVEAFPLVRRLSTTELVVLYFDKQLYSRPIDLQPNCLAVHLILHSKAFLRTIFDRLSDDMRKKLVCKIAAGITPAFAYEDKAAEAVRLLQTLAQ